MKNFDLTLCANDCYLCFIFRRSWIQISGGRSTILTVTVFGFSKYAGNSYGRTLT